MNNRKLLLFTGLFFIALAIIISFVELHPVFFWMLLCIGIIFKTLFLFRTFSAPGFRISGGIYLILVGVTLIFLSMLFKTVYPMPLVRNLLFYSAILFKVTGVSFLFYKTKR